MARLEFEPIEERLDCGDEYVADIVLGRVVNWMGCREGADEDARRMTITAREGITKTE